MASLKDVNMYDYNGAIFAFGIIQGYSTVGSVRMYVSDGRGNTYQYLSEQVYNQSVARINTSTYGSPSFFFNIRTDRDAESGYPEQLNYNVKDPEDSSGRGRYKISFHFYSNTSGTGSPLNSSPMTPSANGNSNVWFQMHHSLSAPKVYYDADNKKIKLSNVGKYRYMIEIRKKNRVDNDFKVRVRDYAYTVLMKCLEGTMGGKYTEVINNWQMDWNKPVQTCRYVNPWENGWNQKALVAFDSGANFSSTARQQYLGYAKEAFQEICDITGMNITVESMSCSDYTSDANKSVGIYIDKYGAYRGNDYEYNFIVRIGNNRTMTFADGSFQGFWSCYAWGSYPEWGIASSMANINVDASKANESISHVIHEEIYQSMNIGADNFEQPLSIHYDPHQPNPDSYSIKDPYDPDNIMWDKEVLRFCYHRDMNGWTPFDFINNVDTPCCLYQDTKSSSGYYEFDISNLNPGEYEVYGWVAGEGSEDPGGGTWSGTASHYNWDGGWDDAPYSIKNQIAISVRSNKPPLWSWSVSNGSATDTQTQNAYSAVTYKTAVTNFSYLVWNDMVDKLKATLDSVGENWDSTYATYDNTKMSSSDKILTATKFNSLRLNIGSHSSTGISTKYKDEYVYGSYFITLANCLNNWINSI